MDFYIFKSSMLLFFVANLVGQSWAQPNNEGEGCTNCRPNDEADCGLLPTSVCTSSIVCCTNNGMCVCRESSIGCEGPFTHDAGRYCMQCCQRTCSDADAPVCSLPDSSNSTAYEITGLMLGDTVTYYCKPEYGNIIGGNQSTCQADGTWTGTAPVCTICGDPDSSETTTYEITGLMIGDTVTYSCKDEYYGLIGDQQRTCQENRIWNGTAPVCTRYCDTFTDETGILTSPNYPGDYDNNVECAWKITVNEMNQISVTFTHFDLEIFISNGGSATGNNCPFDYIEVRDGSDESAPLVYKICGSILPAPFTTTGNSLFVRFITDSVVTYSGFRLTWQ